MKTKPIHGNTKLKPGMAMVLSKGKFYPASTKTKADRHRACRKAIIAKLTKPDPIKLGEELAEYIHRKWCFNAIPDCPAVMETMILQWERDFWREKVFNP